MRPVYRGAYERYARTFGLTSHGRRKVRREFRRADRFFRAALKPFYGQQLKPETIARIKEAICAALNEARL